jgi:hypothetical protein
MSQIFGNLYELRIDQPNINYLPLIEHLFISSSYVFHFEWFKIFMGALLQVLEIILEVQRKRNNEKIIELTKHVSFLFSSLWIPPTFKPRNFFYFLFIWNDLKCYRSPTWNYTNYFWTLIGIYQHTWNVLGVQKPTLVVFNGLFFWVLDPLYFGGL